MPCYDGPYEDPKPDPHDGPAAELLCALLQNDETLAHTSPALHVWWIEHKERDRRRVELEVARARTAAAKEQALAKLTPYERKLLRLE